MNTLEAAVLERFNAQPWRLYTCCKGCGDLANCAGKTRRRVFCLVCFDLGGRA